MTEPMKKLENIDRILGAEEELAPSSGFVAAVMERVRDEAAAPEPIPFPWKRALPGALVAVGGLVWMGVEVVRQGPLRLPEVGIPAPLHWTGTMQDAGWVVTALGASLLSWLLARRMVGSRG